MKNEKAPKKAPLFVQTVKSKPLAVKTSIKAGEHAAKGDPRP
ncbi:MAG TPA: hypothetical protein VF618_23140 [Thermoanaerobaculia bacterium]